jgi:hypothetical protein
MKNSNVRHGMRYGSALKIYAARMALQNARHQAETKRRRR